MTCRSWIRKRTRSQPGRALVGSQDGPELTHGYLGNPFEGNPLLASDAGMTVFMTTSEVAIIGPEIGTADSLLMLADMNELLGRTESMSNPDNSNTMVVYARIPRELREALERQAKADRRTMTATVAMAIEEYIERHSKETRDGN